MINKIINTQGFVMSLIKVSHLSDYPQCYKLYDLLKLKCKCGRYLAYKKKKNSKSGYSLSYYCGESECHQFYGKARPNHSKYMKELAENGTNKLFSATLMKKGELFNKDVNTISFKRKKLKTVGYDTDKLSDSEVVSLNKQYESNKNKSSNHIIKIILGFIEKHNLQEEFGFVTKQYLETLSYDELLKYRYRRDSWHHALYCKDKCGAKKFKRVVKLNLKFNKRGLTYVRTRSSYESNFIDFFESNSIQWDYESIKINIDSNRTYTPDFIFWFEDKKYMVETKGFLLEKDRAKYLSEKINAAFDYCKINEFNGFIFTYNSKPKSLDDLIKQTMKEKF